MAAQNKGGDVFHRHIEFQAEKMPEPRTVKDTRHAADFIMRKAWEFPQGPDHRIKWVGDADNKSVWRMITNALADGFHNFQVDAQ